MSLFTELKKRLALGKELQNSLKEEAESGLKKFQDMNNQRIKYAFSNFSPEMKAAFFEALFFFHVNLPFFSRHNFTVAQVKKVSGRMEEVIKNKTANLYVEGAPNGVIGIERLPEEIHDAFYSFVKDNFFMQELPKAKDSCISSIASLGSVGTIGQKKDSDLDLQIQYDVNHFIFSDSQMDDTHIKTYYNRLVDFYAKEILERSIQKQTRRSEDAHKRNVLHTVRKDAETFLQKKFYKIYKTLIQPDRQFLKEAFQNISNIQSLLLQMLNLVSLYEKNILFPQNKELDKRLFHKAKRIEKYLAVKYPSIEIHFFVYPTYLYRQGIHGNTIETKESSGSAYERILNYELLLPGIQLTNAVPLHYLFSNKIATNAKQYETTVQYIRFQITKLYNPYLSRIVDLGHVEPLSTKYVIEHIGAMYWEAFKAASGNLPKAFLNLLRFEMLLFPKDNCSIIELIKNPHYYDSEDSIVERDFSQSGELNFLANFSQEQAFGKTRHTSATYFSVEEMESKQNKGFSLAGIREMEQLFPFLIQDPWWLRYKALKVFYANRYKAISQKEKEALSYALDLCFALHAGISDVFAEAEEGIHTERGDQLVAFLNRAFPGASRRQLIMIYSGSVSMLIRFEKQLKQLFKNTVQRVNIIAKKLDFNTRSNADEFRIWYYYYKQYFDSEPNIIQKGILNHLQVPRGKLQIAYNNFSKKWIFRALQKIGVVHSEKEAATLNLLPDQVTLFEHTSFLHGLAHCIKNNYYGIYNQNTLRERHTSVEFSVSETKAEQADEWSFVRPDGVVRLVRLIYSIFPPQTYDYRDCITKPREITEILICLNLLEYGRLSILYRDNLKVWRIDNFDHPEIKKNAATYYYGKASIFEEEQIFLTIVNFLESQHFYIQEENINAIHFWVNVNSLHTIHSIGQFMKKETDLNDLFYNKFKERFII